MEYTIWTNTKFSEAAARRLNDGLRGHRLVFAAAANASGLVGGERDRALAEADLAFGQPAVEDCLDHRRLRWIALTTAGYSRYDREEVKETLRARGAALTTSSGVFADPCAQHVLAMMLALGRQLPQSLRDQGGGRPWPYFERRAASRLLTGQTVLLLGFGAIGRRLADLLAPFGVTLLAVRRQARSERAVRVIPPEAVSAALAGADHVVNILPENEATRNFVNARRLACCKPGARFYNVGRGTTVDQPALIEALQSGRLGAAYLDVTEPEPLPPEHPLWSAPNCFITPHTAGGRHDQDEALVEHFLKNLAAFERGAEMADRIV
ncbi:MAG TPA: D-2-hydroxyacid dehydrogenase [Opitutus sp.]|nr:D-2-hydroxyacid dehydrogenase [Opitutus sp.]